ncbi:MAG: PIN domain-containing protein [Anaerolineae bacterium]|nr:PIN domain-containing protein [Anaerolineae bacterium]
MRILLDTSVLVAAIVEAHPMHDVALPWLQRARAEADTGLVAAHSVAELCAILTTLPVRPRIAPAIAWQLIQENVLDALEVVALTGEDYASIIKRLSETGIVGGVTYDALILQSAEKGNAERIVTLNEADFQRAAPQLASRIVSP